MLDQAGLKQGKGACGTVTLIQRFGSAANLNIHLHCLVLDGVYRLNAAGEPEFVEVAAPSDGALQEVLRRIIRRLMKLLVRRGILVEEQGDLYMADPGDDSDEAGPLRRLQVGSAVYRIAFGDRAGQKVLTIRGAPPVDGKVKKQALCANVAALACMRRCGVRPGSGPGAQEVGAAMPVYHASSPSQ